MKMFPHQLSHNQPGMLGLDTEKSVYSVYENNMDYCYLYI